MGTLVKKCGDEYSGSWKEGLKHGKGKLVTGATSCRDVDFNGKNRCSSADRREKNDKSKYNNNNNNLKDSIHIYDGHWLGDKKNGIGMIEYYSGATFEGELEDDKPIKVILIHTAKQHHITHPITHHIFIVLISTTVLLCRELFISPTAPRTRVHFKE